MASQLQAKDFLVLGDSNVGRYYTKIGLHQAQSLDFIQARNKEEVSSALTKITRNYKFVVMAFWSNLIVSAGENASNDIDRMSEIDESFNQIIPIIRLVLCFPYPDPAACIGAPEHFIFIVSLLVSFLKPLYSQGHRGLICKYYLLCFNNMRGSAFSYLLV